ncbi:MAG: ATP-binding protein [Crocosphaera sp.]|nr:ATP-binding protein [Crocosphaera sp.]
MRQILFNLVGNALKFTEKGYIKVSVNSRIFPSTNHQTSRHCSLKISIKDTGIGIVENQQKRVFDVFTQSEGQSNRKYGGTGLGLTITSRLTRILNGTIHLESQLGKGSIFTVSFPQITVGKPQDIIPCEETINIDFNQLLPLTILVVDDVAANRDLLLGYFADSHHTILSANDGQEAIEKLNINQVDLILMDLRMPNMDGYEASQIIKQNTKTYSVPIVIVSASSQDKEKERLKTMCEGFLTKPISRLQLLGTLKKLFPLKTRETITSIPQDNIHKVPSTPIPTSPELLEKLEQQEEKVWHNLRKTMITKDLRQFSQRLQQWGEEYDCHILIDYAHRLETQQQQFDSENLVKTIESFPEIVRSLQ